MDRMRKYSSLSLVGLATEIELSLPDPQSVLVGAAVTRPDRLSDIFLSSKDTQSPKKEGPVEDSDDVTFGTQPLFSKLSESISASTLPTALVVSNLRSATNEGMCVTDLMDKIWHDFRGYLSFNRISLAIRRGPALVITWVRSDASHMRLSLGYTYPYSASSLQSFVDAEQPFRIVHDYEGYLQKEPTSVVTMHLLSEGIYSSMTLPLQDGGEQFGFLFFSSFQKNTYSAERVDIYRKVAHCVERSYRRGKGEHRRPSQKGCATAPIPRRRNRSAENHAPTHPANRAPLSTPVSPALPPGIVGQLSATNPWEVFRTRDVNGAPPLLEGKVLAGKYRLGKTIGRGTFAKVKHACGVANGKQYAVKIVDKLVLSRESRAKILREIQILLKLDHPFIVKVHDVFNEADQLFVVMDYVAGGELYDHIMRNGKLPEDEARRIFAQMALAVGYCHQKGVIHRDLKPENVLLDVEGSVKIIDFGLSNVVNVTSHEMLITQCGSPHYAAPEIATGTGYGPSVDIWSLGVLLYVLLCRRLPYNETTYQKIVAKIHSTPVFIPDHVSKLATHLLHRLLRPQPSDRGTMTEVFAHPWLDLCSLKVTKQMLIYNVNPSVIARHAVAQLRAMYKGSSSRPLLRVKKEDVKRMQAHGSHGTGAIPTRNRVGNTHASHRHATPVAEFTPHESDGDDDHPITLRLEKRIKDQEERPFGTGARRFISFKSKESKKDHRHSPTSSHNRARVRSGGKMARRGPPESVHSTSLALPASVVSTLAIKSKLSKQPSYDV